MTFHPDSLPDLFGKVYIVTGGNGGIGYYTVAHLAEHGAHVYMCARSPAKGNAAIATIKERWPKAHITLLEMDHASLSSVVSAAKIFLSKETALHGLVNNAGIMATPFEMTKDLHEAQWQTNYLAHWVFTSYLLPVMLSTSKTLPSGSVCLVNVTSLGHFSAPKGGINFADLSLPNSSTQNRYGQSKLANILHAKTLNSLYGPSSPSARAGNGEIWTAAVHPGLVATNLADGVESAAMKRLWGVLKLIPVKIYADADTGSWTSVFCAASPDMRAEQSGTYLVRGAKEGWSSSAAKDMGLAERLESWTEAEMEKEGWIEGTS